MKQNNQQPIVHESGLVQLRLAALMAHPDYNLDKAFKGNGKIGPNRNEELEQLDNVSIILDAKIRLEENIKAGKREANNYAYAGFMSDVYDRAVFHGLLDDPVHDRRYYIGSDGNLFDGASCMFRILYNIVNNRRGTDAVADILLED